MVLAGAAGESAADRRSGVGASSPSSSSRASRSATSTSSPATTPTTASRSRRPGSTTPGTPRPAARRRPARACTLTSSSRASIYRGELNANESGTDGRPIILTRDPSWGEGPAVICGSEAVTGWKQGRRQRPHPGAGEGLVRGPRLGAAQRLDGRQGRRRDAHRRWPARRTGRSPTRTTSRASGGPGRTPTSRLTTTRRFNGERRHLAFDKERHQREQAAGLLRGRHRLDHQGLGDGQPVPGQGPGRGPQERLAGVPRAVGRRHRPTRSSAAAASTWKTNRSTSTAPASSGSTRRATAAGSTSACPATRTRTRRTVEVAKRIHMIDSRGMSHVHIRGLTFRFTNVYWNLTAAPYWVSHESLDVRARLRAPAGQRHGHRGDPLHLRARPQGRPPQGRGHGRTPSTGWW